MENDKYRLILEGIKKKIETGQLQVRRISAKGLGEEYEVVISAYRVVLSIGSDATTYIFKLTNDYGDIIETVYVRTSGHASYKPIEEAFRAMRRKAMNADQAIDTLLTTLENLK